MENILNEKLMELIHALGEEIKADDRVAALKDAAKAYNESSELLALITEYNVNQTALSAEYGKDDRDDAVIESIERRLEELYNQVMNNESYKNYLDAKDAYDSFYGEICAELEYTITGNRPCSHDCSSCGGCH